MKKIGILLKWVKPYIPLFLFISFLQIFLPVTYSYVPQFIKYIFDYILAPNSEAANTLPKFLIEFFGRFQAIKCVIIVSLTLAFYQLLRGLLMFINGYAKGKLSESIAYDMRIKLYTHIQDLSYTYHNTVDTGDLIQRCTSDVDTIKGFISSNLPEILYILASLISGGIQMASVNPSIMLITLAGIPITLIGGIIFFKIISKKFTEIEEYESDMTSVLQESVNGVRVVKAFAKEKYEIERFNARSNKFRDESYKLSKYMAFYWGFSDGFVSLQYAITLGYCIYLGIQSYTTGSGISTGDLIVCVSYISMLVYPIRNLGRIISNFGKSSVAAGRIEEILNIPTEYEINGTLKPIIAGNIEFKNVSFKFEDSEKALLNNVSFKINVGETIAIVGKTGSGKSTIANLLVRMLEYDDGSITIDGVELKDIDKHWVRNNIGIILQDPFLYQKSIYENIAIAANNVTKENVYDAAKIAAIHNDILTFDEGYDTLVGEKGVTLSGGQKQRVAISRMLVLNKPIMIFDDSLSAVDTKTDLQIRNSLKQKDTSLTSIIITHRITTAKEADKIIVLENGQISDIGTHHELASRPGLYQSLWNIQGALEDEFVKMVESTINSKVVTD